MYLKPLRLLAVVVLPVREREDVVRVMAFAVAARQPAARVIGVDIADAAIARDIPELCNEIVRFAPLSRNDGRSGGMEGGR